MLRVLLQLLRRDLKIFFRGYQSKLIDTLVLFITNIAVFGYLMPGEGLSSSYGSFLVVAAIGSFGLIEIVGKLGLFLSDLEGERSLSQVLIMPISSSFVLYYIAFFWALSSLLLAIVLFPCGKLLLWDQFDLYAISYGKFLLSFFLGNLFFGAFGLWLGSLIPSMSSLNTIWLRYIVPLWMFGAYFFSWSTAYHTHPWVGILLLCNPIVHIMESMRSSAFGAEGYLPFWPSIFAIVLFTGFCAYHGVCRLQKRLDCL